MKISVNNKKYEIKTNKELTILQACELINIHIPRFCYHDKLSIAGNCRMCFVELPKAKKPTLACSTAIHDGIELYTNTFVVKKAQESVLEFLLVNHPLDCPICDQAGECDLQELTKNFGSDRGRFKELKRSVEDLELGSVVKTIMTRCIHCTRCIRYASEVLTIPSLGTSGRGRDTEVSMYIDKILHSELSGNIIDLCPVGALTSKPYAFRARPWELTHIESIDVLDSVGSSIRVDIKGNKVMRVLPRVNDSLNEEWITDKIRYSYDGFFLQRLTTPFILINRSQYLSTSWNFALSYLSNYLIYFKKHKLLQMTSGNLTDLGTTLINRAIGNTLEGSYVSTAISKNSDLRSNYLLSDKLEKLEQQELHFIVGSNLDYESPLLKLRIQKNYKNKKICYIGPYWNSAIPKSLHIGSSLKKLIRIIEGRSTLLYDFYKKDFINFLYRFNNSSDIPFRHLLNCLVNLINGLKSSYIHSFLNTVSISSLSTHSGAIHENELGLVPNYCHKNKYLFTDSSKKHINYHIGPSTYTNLSDSTSIEKHKELHNSQFSILIGHHKPNVTNSYHYNVILPCSSFIETRQYHMNCLGKVQSTNRALGSPGKSKSPFSISLKLLKKLAPYSYVEYYKQLYSQLRDINFSLPYLTHYHSLISQNNSINRIPVLIPRKALYYFHCTDTITANSPIMTKLIKERKHLESNFYNNITYSI